MEYYDVYFSYDIPFFSSDITYYILLNKGHDLFFIYFFDDIVFYYS